MRKGALRGAFLYRKTFFRVQFKKTAAFDRSNTGVVHDVVKSVSVELPQGTSGRFVLVHGHDNALYKRLQVGLDADADRFGLVGGHGWRRDCHAQPS